MRANYHTHTYRCNHAKGTEEEYTLEAIKKGLSILGFSDHAPFRGDMFEMRMAFSELDEYVNILKNLREKYTKKIDIKLGVEIEYDSGYNAYYEELLGKYNLDYLLLGQHFFTINNTFYNTYSLSDTKQYINYANTVVEAMNTGYFKALAHPDVIFVNDLKWDINCDKAVDIIINNAIKKDFILELNANGIRNGKTKFSDGYRLAYPNENFWKQMANSNIKVIINSDCHNPEDMWDINMEKAYKMAKEYNLNTITEIFG